MAVNIKTYPMCPLVGCQKSMYLSDYRNKYSCDTCNKKYLTSAKGITLNLTAENNNVSRNVTLFNENAEKFLRVEH